jgi:DNA-directed RNA polymerase specialized sigma24 family protein
MIIEAEHVHERHADRQMGQPSALSEHERRVVVAEAVAALSPTQRRLVELSITRQLKPKELAAFVGMTEATVKTQLHRACEKLTGHLGEEIQPQDLAGLQRPPVKPPYIVGGQSENERVGRSSSLV